MNSNFALQPFNNVIIVKNLKFQCYLHFPYFHFISSNITYPNAQVTLNTHNPIFHIASDFKCARSHPPTSASDVSTAADVRVGLSYTDALILGLVEGVTEYLPISSTGHLIITNAWLGLDGDQAMLDAQGEPILVNTDEGFQRPYTIGEAAYAYVIVIQAGAIAAILLLYWSDLWSILMGCLGKDHKGRKLGDQFNCSVPTRSCDRSAARRLDRSQTRQ